MKSQKIDTFSWIILLVLQAILVKNTYRNVLIYSEYNRASKTSHFFGTGFEFTENVGAMWEAIKRCIYDSRNAWREKTLVVICEDDAIHTEIRPHTYCTICPTLERSRYSSTNIGCGFFSDHHVLRYIFIKIHIIIYMY